MANTGNCLCGEITWELTAEPLSVTNCFCKMCRKTHGTAFATYSYVRHGDLHWLSGEEDIARYRSSDFLARVFCPGCGSVVPESDADGSGWYVPTGCHDDGPKPSSNIFVASKAAWHDITNGLPCHDAYPAEHDLGSVPDKALPPQPDGMIRGSCLCGASAFEVTEPITLIHHCHCGRCRHARAAAHATNGFVSGSGIRFTDGEDQLRSYKLPDARHFTQVFCGTCGSIMPRIDRERDIAVIPIGTLDDDPVCRPSRHIFVADKAGWHDITDELPQFPARPPAGEA